MNIVYTSRRLWRNVCIVFTSAKHENEKYQRTFCYTSEYRRYSLKNTEYNVVNLLNVYKPYRSKYVKTERRNCPFQVLVTLCIVTRQVIWLLPKTFEGNTNYQMFRFNKFRWNKNIVTLLVKYHFYFHLKTYISTAKDVINKNILYM